MVILLSWVIAAVLVSMTVGVHYETIRVVSDYIVPWAQRRLHGRRVMMIAILALMAGHIAEIWMFALAMMGLVNYAGFGALTGEFGGTLYDYALYSSVIYTSVGDSNVHPSGPILSIIVSEPLAGLMMIAWSASFTYLKMEQIWKERRR